MLVYQPQLQILNLFKVWLSNEQMTLCISLATVGLMKEVKIICKDLTLKMS